MNFHVVKSLYSAIHLIFKVLRLTCIPYIIGWVIAILSSNVASLYLSRLAVGASHALLTTSVYSIEITTKEMRATFSFFEGMYTSTLVQHVQQYRVSQKSSLLLEGPGRLGFFN